MGAGAGVAQVHIVLGLLHLGLLGRVEIGRKGMGWRCPRAAQGCPGVIAGAGVNQGVRVCWAGLAGLLKCLDPTPVCTVKAEVKPKKWCLGSPDLERAQSATCLFSGLSMVSREFLHL